MARELRIKNTCFQATQTESDRVLNIATTLNKTKSQYIRDVILKDVEKQEKKLLKCASQK